MIFHRSLVQLPVVGTLLLLSSSVFASGFALSEQNGSGLGNGYAGGAASAEDASTIFFNPAGMARLNAMQVVVAGSMAKPSVQFTDRGASTAAAQQTAGGEGGDAGSWALIPNAYFVMGVNSQTRVGVGLNTPFALQTEYERAWIGRFHAIKSKIQTINLNPSISYAVNQMLSLGAGVNYQHLTGDLSNAVNYSAIAFAKGGVPLLAAIGGRDQEGVSTISGSDSAWGYNLGALINLDPHTRIGFAYRSKIKYQLSGSITFAQVPAALSSPQLANGDVTLPISLPDSFLISTFHQLNEHWDCMADATWTGWEVFQQLKIDRSNGTNVQTVQENWQNTWRFSAGTNYHYNPQWLARAGLAHDQTPVSNAYRTARIPDNNRTWLAIGGQYKPSTNDAFDFGYAHLFIKDATISDLQGASGGNLVGHYENSVDILSVQYTRLF